MRICALVIISLMFGCNQRQADVSVEGPCEAWREETAYMIWMDGCMNSVASLYPERKKPHPFALSAYCSPLYSSE